MTHKFEALLYAILFTFWSVRLYYKLYDKRIRKYVLSIGVLIVFWMIIRMSKGVVSSIYLERLCWYLYYIPLIFIPLLFYVCCNSLLNKMNKKIKIILYLISSILFLLVLTNDYHQLVFKFNNGIKLYDDYYHYFGYYIISVWIFYLFGGGMIKLAINSRKTRRSFKSFLPLGILLLGIIYTVAYVLDINGIRNINMSVVNSALICLGIESALYLNLIPNNKKYIRIFKNSNLNMAVVSLNGRIKYTTKKFSSIPDIIMNDIAIDNVKDNYKNNNIIYDVKKNKDSYVLLKQDMTDLYKLREEVSIRQKKLLKQRDSIKLEEKTKKELYEINLRREVTSKIENKLEEKRKEAKDILNKDNISNDDLKKIRRIIIYSKKKSSIIVSEVNNEMYNECDIKVVLNDLITSMSSLNVVGMVIVKNKISINGSVMSTLYDIVYEIIDNLNNTSVMFYLLKEKPYIILKVCVGRPIKIADKIKINNCFLVKETMYGTDTEIIFKLVVGDNI